MKNIQIIALSALLIGSAAIAEAGPLEILFGSRHESQNEHRDNYDRRDNCDRRSGYDHRGDYGNRGWDGGRDHRYHRPMSTEARAQLRLRELGYYRGPIDGSFGYGSKSALARFQRDNRMRPTGWLDECTRRALRL